MSKIKFKAAIVCLVIFSILFSTNLPILTLAQSNFDPIVELSGTVSPDVGVPASPPPGINAPTSPAMASVVIVLTPRNEPAFKALAEAVQDPASPRYLQPLTDTEYQQNFAPGSRVIGDIKSYFAGQGLSLDYESSGGLVLSFKGTLAQRDKAFSTSTEFRESATGDTGLINVAPLKLPTSLAKNIKSVLGFDQLHPAHTHSSGVLPGPTPNSQSPVIQNSPASLRAAYNIPANLNGTGTNVGIVLWTAPDLTNTNRWKSDNGITGAVNIIGVDPASNLTPNSGDLEAHMDIQLVLSAATNATVRFYVAKDSYFDSLLVALQKAVDDNVSSLSGSWGNCENLDYSTLFQGYSTLFQMASAKGIPVFFSSGDSGIFECNSGDTSQVGYSQFPAGDPLVTSVGATYLYRNSNGTWQNEIAWNCPNTSGSNDASCLQSYYPNGGSSSGGVTVHYARPTYQSSISPPFVSKFTNTAANTRLQPDISTNGDPNSGEPIYTNGCIPGSSNNCYLGGGTSASSPFMAGIAALAAQKRGGVVGGFNNFVYNNFAASWGYDVISGYNGSSAVTGWDYTTGKGSIKDVTAFLNAFVPNPVPVISNLSSNSAVKGSAGFTLTINGSNFINGSVVRWNGSNRTTSFINVNQLQSQIPASDLTVAGSFPVTVFNSTPGGGVSNNLQFTVYNPVPTLSSLAQTSATAGNAGFTLTVSGSNFIDSSVVRWNGSDRTTTYVNSGQLTAQILTSDLATAGYFPVTVFNPAPGGGISNSLQFTVNNPTPAIITLAAPAGTYAGGDSFILTVNGSNFVRNSNVLWNGTARTTTFINSGQLTAQISATDIAASGSRAIVVNNPAPGGGNSNTATFNLANTLPAVSEYFPDTVPVQGAGGPGFTLSIKGSYFLSNSVVKWNTLTPTPTVTFINNHLLTVSIPASYLTSAGTATITVINSPGGTSANLSFTIANGCVDSVVSANNTDQNSCGYLRWAVTHPNLKSTVNVALNPGQNIPLTSPLQIPTGLKLNGVCSTSGPAITITGTGTSSSLSLTGGNSFFGLKLIGFGGNNQPQLKVLASSGGANKLTCSKINKT